MLLRLLWFIAIGLFINFIYRLVVATFRYLSRDAASGPPDQTPPEGTPPSKQEPVQYQDVKDARFLDLPPGPHDPS